MATAAIVACVGLASLNGQFEFSGSFGVEGRSFHQEGSFAGQGERGHAAAVLELEAYREWKDGTIALEIEPYLRWDDRDSQRDLFDLREANLLWVRSDWELRVGISKVFWGVAESQHLVDVVNQTDFLANPDGEEKLGQPMVEWVAITDWGDFSVYVLPGFRERSFAGTRGRFRSGLPVREDLATFESSGKTERVDYALRWRQTAGDFDIGLHYFDGTQREPTFALENAEDGRLVLAPHYSLMQQLGLDVQLTRGGWLWKLEAIAREVDEARFSAMVGGFEYTLYGIAGSAVDLGLLSELHLDSRGAMAPTSFNRDVFVGGRFAWNDDADTSMIVGAIWDLDTQAALGRLEFQRRIGSDLRLEIEALQFSNLDRADPLFSARRDSFAQVSLTRFF